MFTFSDAWVLTTLILINDRTTLSQLIACGDIINHAIFTKEDVNTALSKFLELNFIEIDQNKNMLVTSSGLRLPTKSFYKSGLFSKVEILLKVLKKYAVKEIEIIEFFSDIEMKQAYSEYEKNTNIDNRNP